MDSDISNGEKNDLLTIYQSVIDQLHFNISSMWESTKFFTSVLTYLFSLSLGALYFSFEIEDANSKITFYIFMVLISIITALVSYYGKIELTRAYKRFLNMAAVNMKIREKLNLNTPHDFKCFTEEKYYWPDRFLNIYKNYDEFEKECLERKNTIYSSLARIFSIYQFFSFIITCIYCSLIIIQII